MVVAEERVSIPVLHLRALCSPFLFERRTPDTLTHRTGVKSLWVRSWSLAADGRGVSSCPGSWECVDRRRSQLRRLIVLPWLVVSV